MWKKSKYTVSSEQCKTIHVTQDMREKGILFWELRNKNVTWCLSLITSYVNVWHPSGLEAIVGELEKMNTGKTFMNVLSGIFNQILENLMISWGTYLKKSWRCYAGKSLNSTVAWLFWVKCPNDSTWCKSPENSPCLVLMLISGLYLVWMLYLFSCVNLCLCEALKISEHLRVVWMTVLQSSGIPALDVVHQGPLWGTLYCFVSPTIVWHPAMVLVHAM